MFAKLEITFDVSTAAEQKLWPYDPAPPAGVAAGAGVSVAAIFADPRGREYEQPAFYWQRYEDGVRNGRDWRLPTGAFAWKVRFSPNQTGTWKYRLVARDRTGTTMTEWRSFSVASSASRGFVRVSRADTRYFEFDDGSLFTGLGFQVPEHLQAPEARGGPMYAALGGSGVNFARLWISSLYGAAWTPWVGGRNRYDGYLPVAGLMPLTDPRTRETMLTLRMDYEPAGDTGWFDACRLQWFDEFHAVKPRTAYRVQATYRAGRVSGPRNPRFPDHGFVVKIGGMFPACYEPGTSRAVTTYGRETGDWARVEGTWRSGERFFLPKVHLALENVREGVVHVRSVSIREQRPDGSLGPEILSGSSMEHHPAVSDAKADALDRIVRLAEQNGVYLKLVVMEKDDEVYKKLADDGSFVTNADNRSGVYGTGRTVNRTRWLQQAWWRYLQARWGYSPNVHSWELLNEGDPGSTRHYQLADEFGKYMHFGVFGRRPGETFDHPNDHLVTTSFWHSFPAAPFWGSAQYPHVDYADIHAYVSTSFAPAAEKARMQWDAAYYHTWHSEAVAAARIGKPVVRGEAGLDSPGRQDERALGLERDRQGVWLHNFLWASLHAGALYEIYWWRSHIWGPHGDHRGMYRPLSRFLADLPLNKGGYADWGGTVSNPGLRVVGQRHEKAGRLHMWIQNTGHTWKAVVDGRRVDPVSGTVRAPGFAAGAEYEVEWWDTWSSESMVRREIVRPDAAGVIALTIADLATDVAVKVRPAPDGRRKS